MATMYERRSKLTPRQQARLIEHFVAGSTARAASEIVGIQANTSIRFYMRLRQLIASNIRKGAKFLTLYGLPSPGYAG